jgi:hypothetical protein
MFADDGTAASLRLVDCTPTTTGVIVASYVPASQASNVGPASVA